MASEHAGPSLNAPSSAPSDVTATAEPIYQPSRDIVHFPAFAEVAERLRRAHETWWAAWVSPEHGITAPTLCLQVREFTHGYLWGNDTIYLYLNEHDIEDVMTEDQRREMGLTAPGRHVRGLEWATITGFLLHELLHAYQAKVMLEPTPDGIALFENPPRRWDGPGHDARFYSAIAAVAPHFRLTAEEFAREL